MPMDYEDLLQKGNELGDKAIEYGDKAQKWETDFKKTSIKNRSILAKAKNSIMQFPVYITNRGIRINEAHLISKYLERVYASYVQIELSKHKFMSTNELNGLKFLRGFHSNVMESANVRNEYYTPIDELDGMVQNSISNTIAMENGVVAEFREVVIKDRNFLAENARLMNVPLTGFFLEANTNSGSLRDLKQKDTVTDKEIPEKVYTDDNLDRVARGLGITTDLLKTTIKNTNGFKANVNGAERMIYHKRVTRDGHSKDLFFTPAEKSRVVTRVSSTTEKEKPIAAPEILKDVDIRKVNGMVPYGIKCTFRVKEDPHAPDIEYIIGVKTVLHLVDIKDLADDIRPILEGSMKNLRKLKYKTGEISFLDYWFNFSEIKADAAKRLNPKTRWLSNLKKLGNATRLRGTAFKDMANEIYDDHIPIPNATLVISKNEVDTIKEKTGVDIEHINTATKLMDRLYLICIMIVDGSAGTLRVLLSDNTDWDNQSIAQLDSELAKLDNSSSIKELGKLIHTRR